MSTKTIYKRIALVAVATLGAGLLSAAPARAVFTLPVWVDTATTVGGVAITANTATVTRTLNTQVNAAAVSTITAPAGSAIVFTIKNAEAFVTTNIIDMSIDGVLVQSNTTIGTNPTAVTTTRNLPSPAVQTTYNYVLTVYETAGTTRAASTLTTSIPVAITVVPAAGYSASLSSALMRGDNDATTPTAATNGAAAIGSATAAAAQRAAINVLIKNTSNAALATGRTLSAEITGPGFLFFENAAIGAGKCTATPTFGAATGRSLSGLAIDDDTYIYVCADGSPGVATITLTTVETATGVRTVLDTKKVTFFGAVSKITATGVWTIGSAGGGTVGSAAANRTAGIVPSVIIKAEDAAGNPVSSLTFTAQSTNALVMTTTIGQAEDIKTAANVASSGGGGFYNIQTNASAASKSGDKATMTFRIANPADATGLTFLTSAVDFTIGGTIATETIDFDKNDYAAGEGMVITRTAKDSAGNPVADGLASPAITFSKATGGTAPAAGVYVKGVSASSASAAAASVFAPVTPGAFSALATSGNAAATKLSVSASVEDSSAAATDAANEATDAANAATDAALAAADAADSATAAAQDAADAVAALSTRVSTLVSNLRKQITALTKLVQRLL